jgi:hypothetical protein
VADTADSAMLTLFKSMKVRYSGVPGDLEFERLWMPLKGISINKNYIGKLCYPIAIKSYTKYRGYQRIVLGHSGIIDTAVAKIGDFIVEYLRKFAAICKKTLTLVSEVWGK